MGSQVKIKKIKIISGISIVFLAVIFLAFIPALTSAKVAGPCVNCHTMHNSQDGAAVSAAGPNQYLINVGANICVACHSSDVANETIKDLGGGTRIPIVYNTTGYPTNPLAGGNFYYVSTGSPKVNKDAYGHNVYGISAQDTEITAIEGAPGNKNCGGVANVCHRTLAVAPQSNNFNKGGCQGCHVNVFHHTDNDEYRFLSGHEGANYYVQGVEDPNWEQNPTLANHNVYKGYNGPVGDAVTLETTKSISSYCGGCHYYFHRNTSIGGPSSPWLRHPTDIKLPETGEYAAYNPVTTYNNQTPVAYTNPSSPTRATAVVMCLSCHRPHGSDQPDMLRWDYSTSQLGGSGGCLNCHTTK